MNWLDHLPHQIPFRAASAVKRSDGKTLEGTYVCTANDVLTPQIALIEAMAQFAGGLAFHEHAGHGLLSAVDSCEITRAIEPGDAVDIVVTLEASFGGIHRITGSGSIGGLECIRGRFYLAEPQPHENT